MSKRGKQCRHPSAVVRYLCGPYVTVWKPWTNYTKFCADCKATLSLGPATDTPQTAVELRAAEIAARGSRPNTCNLVDIDADCEECGWEDQAVMHCPTTTRDGYQAGYLARVIATHDADHAKAGESIDELIDRSSIGAGLRNIRENGIDAELAELERKR